MIDDRQNPDLLKREQDFHDRWASTIDIEDHQVVIQVALPLMLSFIEPMIQKAITEKGQKLLK